MSKTRQQENRLDSVGNVYKKCFFYLRRVVMVIGVLSTAFIICTLPLTYMYISSMMYRPETTMLMDISYISAFNNSLLNPLLYMCLTGARKDFAAKFSCCRVKKGIYTVYLVRIFSTLTLQRLVLRILQKKQRVQKYEEINSYFRNESIVILE